MSLSADYRRLLNREAKIYSVIQKNFKKQSKFFMENVQDLYEKYPLNISIAWNNLNNQQVHLYPDKKNRETIE
jgi:hypothetical protein